MRFAATLVVVLVVVGCAGRRSFDPPLPETREGLGQIAVVAVPAIKGTVHARPLLSDEAAAAGEAALDIVLDGVDVGCDPNWEWLWPLTCPLSFVVSVAMAPVAAVVAAGVQHELARSGEDMAFAVSNLEKTLDDVEPSEDLRDLVIAAGMEGAGLELSAREDLGADLYKSLSSEGFSTLLEVQVMEFLLTFEGNRDPDVTVLLGASGELLRISDGRPLYRQTWRYVSEEKKYFEIAFDGARPLREEIHAGLEALARKMFDDLFVSTTPENHVTDLEPGIPATASARQYREPVEE